MEETGRSLLRKFAWLKPVSRNICEHVLSLQIVLSYPSDNCEKIVPIYNYNLFSFVIVSNAFLCSSCEGRLQSTLSCSNFPTESNAQKRTSRKPLGISAFVTSRPAYCCGWNCHNLFRKAQKSSPVRI